ncbi:MAG: hypothetical protein GY856_50110 [bacterium]|nr:hypothetical protein [bacterium]
MERRTKTRKSRRVQVYFSERGSEKRRLGYSVDISTSGMFVATNQPLPRGTRIRVEVSSAERGFVVEAMVARVVRSTQALQAIRQSGMGVRFLTVEELVGEVMPEIGSRPPEMRHPVEEGVYQVWFANRAQFLEAYRRDIATGGLFVPSDRPAKLHETITVELRIAESDVKPLRFEARVVQCLEPIMPGNGSTSNLMAGMGVELLTYDRTLKAMRALVGQPGPDS